MEKNKKKQCPLKTSEWVQYLTFEQYRERTDYRDAETFILTLTLIILTIINAIFVILSITSIFFDIDTLTKFVVFGCIFLIIVIGIMAYFLRRLKTLKMRRDEVIEDEARIIEDVLYGRLKDSDKILKKYMNIFKK